MSHKTWGLTFRRVGTGWTAFSIRGEATITHEEQGWCVRGEVKYPRADYRIVKEPSEMTEPWSDERFVTPTDHIKGGGPVGKFERLGLKNYKVAFTEVYHKISLMPPTVPYAVAVDTEHPTAEGVRDGKLWQEKLEAYRKVSEANAKEVDRALAVGRTEICEALYAKLMGTGTMNTSKKTMTLNLTDAEMQVLDQLSEQKELSKTALLRQALRLYQVVDARIARGEKLFFEDSLKQKSEIMLF